MDRDETMIVAGIGFQSDASSAEIVALVSRAMREAALAASDLTLLATIDARAGESAFAQAAEALKVPCAVVDPDTLRRAAPGVKTHSMRIASLHGVGSVAEAAALGCAGNDAQLLLPRIASSRVTCALARGQSR